jgi:radical SAM/Cys-rich protein
MNIAISTRVTTQRAGFGQALRSHGLERLTRAELRELQINVGRLCNQACTHCHVDAGPKRTEIMSWATMEKILDWARRNDIEHVDITGGAPELNPNFRRLVDAFVAMDASIIARCNLTVVFEPGQQDLPEWYAERGVRLVCSLPCYSAANVDEQRGRGVFDKSIRALQRFNAVGYGRRPDRVLDLVYNPGGPFLPPSQSQLEQDYRARLGADLGIEFSNLLTLTNLPINRFAHYLDRTGQRDSYQQLLEDHFNPATVAGLMCRHLISVDWLGRVYDCDFNQMLNLPLNPVQGVHIWEIHKARLTDSHIAVGAHCFGCTAGAGSSCGGTLT